MDAAVNTKLSAAQKMDFLQSCRHRIIIYLSILGGSDLGGSDSFFPGIPNFSMVLT